LHGDAEAVPGLAVDRFDRVVVIHADSAAILERWRPALEDELGSAYDAAYAKVHPRSASRLSEADLHTVAPSRPLWGPPIDELDVIENGLRYAIKPAAGLSPGLFLDMREVRAWLRQIASGRTVLNLFAYTCSFGVCASAGGATHVLNLDLSRSYLAWGQHNYALNGLAVDEHDFVYGDAFDWLGRFARRRTRFDVVIVDPPSFSSTPFSVTRDYTRLVAAAARVVAPDGMLLAATNHAGTSDERFEAWVHNGLSMAERDGQVIRRWHEPEVDFPLARGGKPYLKVRALVLD
jgi:23S rRNA (cytosine1962-C5)-methyltransferase